MVGKVDWNKAKRSLVLQAASVKQAVFHPRLTDSLTDCKRPSDRQKMGHETHQLASGSDARCTGATVTYGTPVKKDDLSTQESRKRSSGKIGARLKIVKVPKTWIAREKRLLLF